MAASSERKHPFHILPPSPWPLVASVGAFLMALGGAHMMHGEPPWLLALGVAVVVFTMFGWWRAVICEGYHEQSHTSAVQRGLRMGMALFIASEVMFFVAFFWAYFHNALHVSPVVAGQWPPEGIEPLHAVGLPLINTSILLLSGVVLMWGRHGLLHGRRRQAVGGIAGAALLGALFLILQAIEYGEAAFAFRSGIYASTFYMATGFHGFHVFVGTCALLVMAVRCSRGTLSPDHHLGLEAAEWYWHFVDVVWLFLFVFFYVWVGA